MNYLDLISNALTDTKDSLKLFGPELALCGTIIVMLVLRVPNLTRRWIPTWLVALAGALVALWLSEPCALLASEPVVRQELFSGMLVYDGFTVFFRALLAFFAVLFILLTRVTRLSLEEGGADFYTLVLGAILGMCLMVSANHLLMVFLAIEMASVPSYVMAGLRKGERKASEAAMKYAIYGAGAAGIMLYGISLLAGVAGSAHLPTIAERLASGAGDGMPVVLILAGVMIAAGIAFKLSAVPFHFWCPDVFEGASAEVNAFLSIASKAAALALLIRLTVAVAAPALPAATEMADQTPVVQLVSDGTASSDDAASSLTIAARLGDIRNFLVYLVAIMAAVTCTFGNLAAYGQTNIKRLLAYSTIAHAGYMMMPVAAGLSMVESNPIGAQAAFASVLVYLVIYVFMNLGAFAVVAILRNEMGSSKISDYAGLVRSSPGLVVCFTAILISLVGLPPLAGFMAKLVIFSGLVEAHMYTLLIIGGLNTLISLFYYLRVIKVMVLESPQEDREPVRFSLLSMPGIYLTAMTIPVLFLVVQWDGLNAWSRAACSQLFGF